MIPEAFYKDLLKQIAVPQDDIDAARKKRDELGEVIINSLDPDFEGASFFPAGALAAGTQIRPLNDVDIVMELPRIPPEWIDNPAAAMKAMKDLISEEIRGKFEISSHAIKITYPDEDFTADVVIGVTQSKGIAIPECPSDGEHRWIATHPKRHAQQVRERNSDFGSAAFSQEIRILKYLNREWKLRDDQERKPLSSFHVTALALALLRQANNFSIMTPDFLEGASSLILRPLPDPAGVGADLEAKDPKYASDLLAEAGSKTRKALSSSETEAERLLTEVFGEPRKRETLLGPGPVSISKSGSLVAGLVGERAVKAVRSHGDAQSG